MRSGPVKQIILSGLLLILSAAISVLKADESHLYDFLWLDPDKKVYVLQNKVYKKDETFYANLGFIRGLTNEYQTTNGAHFSTGYYFTEEWAVEGYYNTYNNTDNDAYKSLQSLNQSVPFIRKVEKQYGAMGVWSPFYGKINTFNKIIYFDWSFGAGVGQIYTESNALTVASPSTSDIYQDEKYLSVPTKTALRIHATKNIHLNLEYLRVNYRAPGPQIPNQSRQTKWRSNTDVIISIGFSF